MTRADLELKKYNMARHLQQMWQTSTPSYTPPLSCFVMWLSEHRWGVCTQALKAVPRKLKSNPDMTDDMLLTYTENIMRRLDFKT
jgi:hypothetical protein